MAKSANCIVIKNVDKCDVFKNMSHTIPVRKQKLQIIEYEAFLALRSKKIRQTRSEYRDLLFSCRNEIETLIENAIHAISRRNDVEELNRELEKLRKILK
jgi:hypothetical protein